MWTIQTPQGPRKFPGELCSKAIGGSKANFDQAFKDLFRPQVAGQDGRCPEEAVAEPKKQLRTRAFKNTSPAPNVNKVDWATWLVSDIQDASSDNDLDYKDIEEEEEAEELSDNDLSDLHRARSCGDRV